MGATNGGPRVCVLGGGAAGLAAAWYLRQRGYRQVVVLEKEDRPGGKCHTVSVDGRPYELGAFTATLAYGDVLKIAEAVGAATGPQPERLGMRWDSHPPKAQGLLASVLDDTSFFQLALAQLRYLWVLFKTRRVLGPPGFGQVSDAGPQPDLCMPFGDYADKHGITALVNVFRLAFNDMGYGHIRQVPAAYVLKYMGFWNVVTITLYMLGIGFGWPKRFVQGYGRLWQCVAWRLHVRLQARVHSIVREEGRVTVEWTTPRRDDHGHVTEVPHREVFDKLILACPLDATEAFLDARAEERALWYGGVIDWNDYYVALCHTRGVPPKIWDAMDGRAPGHSWEILRGWPDRGVTSFYAFGEELPGGGHVDGPYVKAALREDVQRAFQGRAQVEDDVMLHCWQYFPHVSVEQMRGGYYTRLEALQGRHDTFVTGSLPAFETVQTVVTYSKALVEAHFPVVGPAPD